MADEKEQSMADGKERVMAEADEAVASAFEAGDDAGPTGYKGCEAEEGLDEGMIKLNALRERLRRECADTFNGMIEYRDLLKRNGFIGCGMECTDEVFEEWFGDALDILDDAGDGEKDDGKLYRFETFLDHEADADEWAEE